MTEQSAVEGTPESVRISGVVVGFDGSPAAEIALEWAASTAWARGLPLTVLAARPDAEAEAVFLREAMGEDLIEPAMALMLADAEQRMQQMHPDLMINTVIHPDSPVDGLLAASTTATMIVIGSRGLGGFAGLLLGSTAMEVAPYADCPVVVQYVPDEHTAVAREDARHPSAVVVGFDGSTGAERALRFGLEQAQATGLGVAVVYVSSGADGHDPQPCSPADPALPEEVSADLRVAQGIAESFPEVSVEYLHGVGRPTPILIREASGAPLAVVGSRGRGGFAALLLGSVGLQMLLHAECPVALVRDVGVD